MVGAKPYGQLHYREVNGNRMAYVDEGEGDAIVFAHGNPTSSYLWRNVVPHLEGLGRLVAADLIGMGGSDKLHPSGPDRYNYAEQRDYLFALWDALDLGDNVIFVLHDWGSALGFDWANQHRDRVGGIAFMEAIVAPISWSEFLPDLRGVFAGFRSPQGETMVLEQNIFIEHVLPAGMARQLSDEEMDHYRRPFVDPGESRRPTLSWPRNIPIDGEPADVVSVVNDYSRWLAESDVPKLFVNAEPGSIVHGRMRDVIRSWPNLTETTVSGVHFVQEDRPDEIGAAVAQFVRKLRSRQAVSDTRLQTAGRRRKGNDGMPTLTDAVSLARSDQGLAIVSTLRADASIQASLINAGVLNHPATAMPGLAFVTYGKVKLANLRARPQVSVTFRQGWQWATVEGRAELAGPDDPQTWLTSAEQLRVLLREIFAAAGGTHDDWDTYDRVMLEERRTAVLINPTRIYSNG